MAVWRVAIFAAIVIVQGCASLPPAPPEPVPRAAPVGPVPLPGASDDVPIDRCADTAEGFEDWVVSFGHHATAQGIPPELVARALGNVAYDERVIELDRAQSKRKRTFEEFASAHVTPSRIKRGKATFRTHAELFTKITARFGVPKEIVVAIWGLETDFGANQGNTRSLRALATLAYDCRRAERFRGELLSALRVVARGDLSVESMVGAWAGEVGQTQFLPSSYEKYGIDFDGDGRIDLIRSTDDALGSTANYLAAHGWQAGRAYSENAPNFAVLEAWNKSEVYRRTIVLYATKLAK